MKVMLPYVHQMSEKIDGMEYLKAIEKAGRVCYKSEDRITDDSAPKFVQMLLRNSHEAMIEHAPHISMKFVCDRGVSHEIVRHRLFSFAQESTRYCNYGKDEHISFILPEWFAESSKIALLSESPVSFTDFFESRRPLVQRLPDDEGCWVQAMLTAEEFYNNLIKQNWSPQKARSVLPNSLKTEIVVTGNARQWRHFFKLRTATDAHPQMRELARPACDLLQLQIPILFDDIEWYEKEV